jgi:hypothetical protein
MSEWHPQELELARTSEAGTSGGLADHLRWCSRCRGVAADYEWLEGEITYALDAALKDVPVPQPEWEGVNERLELDPRRVVGRQILAAAATAMMAYLMLVAPSFVGGGLRAEGVPSPDIGPVRVPVSADGHRVGTGTELSLTTTPDMSVLSGERTVSLPFVPPPEPPDPEA